MRKVAILAGIIAAVLLAMQPVLQAKQKDRGPSGPQCPAFEDHFRVEKDLGLNSEQLKKFAEIDTNFEKKMLEFEEKLTPRHIRLQRMLLEDKVDMEKIRPLVKEISELMAEMEMAKIQHQADIVSVLTSEQKVKMRHMMMPAMNDRMGPPPEEFGPSFCGF